VKCHLVSFGIDILYTGDGKGVGRERRDVPGGIARTSLDCRGVRGVPLL
jgi:hypothetical protein